MGDNGHVPPPPAPNPLLAELLERCRRRDRAAFDLLVRRFRDYAVLLATSILNDAHLAEDATQSAFVTVLLHLEDLRDDRAFPAWLRLVLRTECNRLTRQLRPAANLADAIPAFSSTPPDSAALAEARELVRAALASLPPLQRHPAELYYLDELPQSTIGQLLNLPEGTVKRRLHDARQSLRETLKPQLPL